mmetsp:Transcript_18174/g.23514  ORF Transcript_18174/g.23514 Transcript_18174/m.23514 type:complete len:556 (-) Transcript_18174:270-1937(-)
MVHSILNKVLLLLLNASFCSCFKIHSFSQQPLSGRIQVQYEAASNRLKPLKSQNILEELRGLDPNTLDTIWERVLDTVEDASLHVRRKFRTKLTRSELETKKGDVPRVVVLGFGWGAHAISKVVDTDACDVVFVSPRNYFLFTPMLASTAVGTVEYRSITEPARKANPVAGFYEGSCVDVFPEKQEIVIESSSISINQAKDKLTVPYDYLVWAVGTKTGTFGTPGAKENCFFIKEIEDSVLLRRAIVDSFEKASLPKTSEEEIKRLLTFVIVGGGPTGVEFTAELVDFLKNDLPAYYPLLIDYVSVKLIQAGDTILPVFDASLQKKGMEQLTSNQFVEILLNTKVAEVQEEKMIFTNGNELQYGVAVWAAGTESRNITKLLISKIEEQASAPETKRGNVLVDDWMRVKGTNGTILAIGDCTTMESGRLPATGQVAAQQGAFVGRLLSRGYDITQTTPRLDQKEDPIKSAWINLRGYTEAKPFRFLNLGLLAYVGDRKALAQVQTGNSTWARAYGEVGFLLWRSVYVVKQVSTRNRILVLFDRLKSKLFGRDITRL